MDLFGFFAGLLTLALIYGVLTLGLHVQFGLAGMLNFGHVAFFAVGAFTSALFSLPPKGTEAYLAIDGRYQFGLGLPIPLTFVAAGIAGGLLALLIGSTSVRLGSHYLAVATFAMAEIVRSVLNNESWLTRGQSGILGVPQPLRGAFATSDYPFFYLALTAVITGLLLVVAVRLTASPFGRVLRAVREDELAARSLGKPAPGLKLRAFALGGVLAGLAGSLWTHSLGIIHVGQFVPIITFQVWLALLLGGRGNPFGAVLGAIVLMAITEGTRFLDGLAFLDPLTRRNPSFVPSLRYVIIGLLLIAVVRFFPRGILPERLRPPPRAASGGDPR